MLTAALPRAMHHTQTLYQNTCPNVSQDTISQAPCTGWCTVRFSTHLMLCSCVLRGIHQRKYCSKAMPSCSMERLSGEGGGGGGGRGTGAAGAPSPSARVESRKLRVQAGVLYATSVFCCDGESWLGSTAEGGIDGIDVFFFSSLRGSTSE